MTDQRPLCDEQALRSGALAAIRIAERGYSEVEAEYLTAEKWFPHHGEEWGARADALQCAGTTLLRARDPLYLARRAYEAGLYEAALRYADAAAVEIYESSVSPDIPPVAGLSPVEQAVLDVIEGGRALSLPALCDRIPWRTDASVADTGAAVEPLESKGLVKTAPTVLVELAP